MCATGSLSQNYVCTSRFPHEHSLLHLSFLVITTAPRYMKRNFHNSTDISPTNQSLFDIFSLTPLTFVEICGNKMPTRCNRGLYCRSYCLLNMFRASLCPSPGAQKYYTVVAVCGISCCKNVKNNFVSFCGICILSLKCRVLSRFVTKCVECRGGTQPPRHSTHLVTNLDNT